jgi:hypothetical protein
LSSAGPTRSVAAALAAETSRGPASRCTGRGRGCSRAIPLCPGGDPGRPDEGWWPKLIAHWERNRRRMPAVPHLHPMTASGPTCSVRSDLWTTSHASAARTPTAPATVNATPEISRSAPATACRTISVCSTAMPARLASPNARARPCSTPTSHPRRPTTSWPTSSRAGGSDRPHGSSASIAIPSHDWPGWPDSTLTTATTNSWRNRSVPSPFQ